jgi:hypothetical protein
MHGRANVQQRRSHRPRPLLEAPVTFTSVHANPLAPAVQAVGAQDLALNAPWLKAVLGLYPDSVPTGYLLADGWAAWPVERAASCREPAGDREMQAWHVCVHRPRCGI